MSLKPLNAPLTMDFAKVYDSYRPRAPRILTKLLASFGRLKHPRVADLGSGTGLSSFEWLGIAQSVVGVEPSEPFRKYAESMIGNRHPYAQDLEFVPGRGEATGLQDREFDLVICGESLHWMEPEATLLEAARILRRTGIFAAYTHDLPPVIDREVDEAFVQYIEQIKSVENQLKECMFGNYEWKPKQFEERIRNVGQFSSTRRIYLHNDEQRNAAEVVGLAEAFADVSWLVEKGVADAPGWLKALQEVVTATIGHRRVPCTIGATLVMAVKA